MFDQSAPTQPGPTVRTAQQWVSVLARYRDPDTRRSWLELAATLVPFVALWALAWAALSISPWLTLLIALPLSGFVLRLFVIQHDCGHGAFFKSRKMNDWTGRALGVLTITPYDIWRRAHSIHHSTSGNLGRRGIGDIHTMTLAEYRALSPRKRFHYRIYRNPITLFALAPFYLFFVDNRLPIGLMGQIKYWLSAMGTNLALFSLLAGVYAFGGWAPILLIFVPSTLLAATIGMWLFYVQHQFENTHWQDDQAWQLHEAALAGSSHYVLPKPLQWLSANIGIHHVHHLYSRIPFYRLPEVLRDHPVLADCNRMTIRQSLQSVHLHVWDEDTKRLLTFSEAHTRLA